MYCVCVFMLGLWKVQYRIPFCLEASGATWGNFFFFWSITVIFLPLSWILECAFLSISFSFVSPACSVCFSYYLQVHLSAELFSFLFYPAVTVYFNICAMLLMWVILSLYQLTVPPCLSVISAPSEIQTLVDPLHMAVKVTWALLYKDTHTPSIEIQVRFPPTLSQLQ